MKKSLLMIAAMFAAVCLNARVINIDLSSYQLIDENTVVAIANGELTATYDLEAWGSGGIKYALDDLNVTNLSFDYKSDGTVESWVSFLVYLEDSEGGQWYSSAADLSISSWNAEWENKSFMPSDVLWNSSTAESPVLPFKALGFMANPANATHAAFSIRNVSLTVEGDETAVDQVNTEAKVVKVIRNGQVLFVRDGKTFNALGTEVR